MILTCPFCQEEVTPLPDGICPECESYLKRSNSMALDDQWPVENEWTETDWGQDMEEINGISNTQS